MLDVDLFLLRKKMSWAVRWPSVGDHWFTQQSAMFESVIHLTHSLRSTLPFCSPLISFSHFSQCFSYRSFSVSAALPFSAIRKSWQWLHQLQKWRDSSATWSWQGRWEEADSASTLTKVGVQMSRCWGGKKSALILRVFSQTVSGFIHGGSFAPLFWVMFLVHPHLRLGWPQNGQGGKTSRFSARFSRELQCFKAQLQTSTIQTAS